MPRFRHIDDASIVEKIAQLEKRVYERFPERNLPRVCHTLHETALDTQNRLAFITRPNWWLRIGIGALVLLVLVGTVAIAAKLAVVDERLTLTELLAAIEAGLNDLLLISAAIIFLVTLETRIKRRRTLDALHELRTLAHVIDMHQLTKDPTRLLLARADTPSSPRESLSPFQLQRYLDYCSEMLSLIGKVAALYVQDLSDPVVVSAVNDIEGLTTSLSRKIWQKIMIIHNFEGARAEIGAEATPSGIMRVPPLDDL
jgi:hypothetical protein